MTTQFKYDYWKVMASLAIRPTNWVCHYPYCIENKEEKMYVWISNGHFALNFRINGKEYGGVSYFSVFLGWASPWRRKLLKRARQTALSPWVEKYGDAWDKIKQMEGTREGLEHERKKKRSI